MTCHASALEGDARSTAPAGVNFDTDGDVQRYVDRIRVRALDRKDMPPTRSLASCNQAVLETFVSELESGPCLPSCSGRACGDDGCGGSCGTCEAGLACATDTGQCGNSLCSTNCESAACGDDGCGGSCGTCGFDLQCSSQRTCVCPAGVTCSCTPNCSGISCGDDGCGGSCGKCSSSQSCTSGQCVYLSKSFSADVWPIIQAHACFESQCHSQPSPQQGLDMSSSSTAYANLVNVASMECSSGKVRVAPGDISASYIINKLTGSGMCSGVRMPPFPRAPLSQSQLDTIRAWIDTGAAP